MAREVTLFRVFGIPIKASLSWLFLVALIVLAFGLIFATPELRRAIAATGMAGAVLALPLLPTRYFAFLGEVGTTRDLKHFRGKASVLIDGNAIS